MVSNVLPALLAQAGGGSPASAAASAYLALRRWSGGLTLAPSGPAPDWGVVSVLLVALTATAILAIVFQGPSTFARQCFDLRETARLVREATGRVWMARRLVVVLLISSVVSWTGALALGFFSGDAERGRSDLLSLKRSRGPSELVLEHAALAATTPLRDLAGLGDNLPLLATALVVLLWAMRANGDLSDRRDAIAPAAPPPVEDWTAIPALIPTTCVVLYLLYRMFTKVAGAGDLPVGNCLILEVLLIPGLMLACDGLLLAWVLTEIRGAGGQQDTDAILDVRPAIQLMPAACLACFAALPARYLATVLLLASQHVPSSWLATRSGDLLRWGLGPGLYIVQGASLAALGLVGAVAWSRGDLRGAGRGFQRTVSRQGGRLFLVAAFAAVASAGASGAAYILILLIPAAGWVLPTADAYSHYATIPVGLWTLAAVVLLAEKSLPVARNRSGLESRRPASTGGSSDLDGDAVTIVQADAGEPQAPPNPVSGETSVR